MKLKQGKFEFKFKLNKVHLPLNNYRYMVRNCGYTVVATMTQGVSQHQSNFAAQARPTTCRVGSGSGGVMRPHPKPCNGSRPNPEVSHHQPHGSGARWWSWAWLVLPHMSG
jgi:hypothetical protein